MARLQTLLGRIPHASKVIDSRSPLSAVIPIVFALVVLWYGLPAVVDGYKYRGNDDFYFLLHAGNVVRDEPSVLYDDVNQTRWNEEHDYSFPEWYPYPPGVAYLAVPFTFIYDEAALFGYRALIALSTVYLALKVARAFQSQAWGFAMGAAIICWEPILLNAKIGQTGMVVTVAIALGANAYLRDRITGAMIFGLLALKPSTILGPALAVSLARPKVWPYFAVAALGVVFVPFVLLGPHALVEWLHTLYERSAIDFGGGHRYNQGLSSVVDFRGVIGVAVLAVLGSALFLVARRVQSRLGVEIAVAFSILVGFLLNPHSLLYDWGVAFVALYLLRRSPLVQGPYVDFSMGLLGISLFVAGQLAWHWASLNAVVNAMTIWALAVSAVVLILAFVRKPDVAEESSPTASRSEAPLPRPEPG